VFKRKSKESQKMKEALFDLINRGWVANYPYAAERFSKEYEDD